MKSKALFCILKKIRTVTPQRLLSVIINSNTLGKFIYLIWISNSSITLGVQSKSQYRHLAYKISPHLIWRIFISTRFGSIAIMMISFYLTLKQIPTFKILFFLSKDFIRGESLIAKNPTWENQKYLTIGWVNKNVVKEYLVWIIFTAADTPSSIQLIKFQIKYIPQKHSRKLVISTGM